MKLLIYNIISNQCSQALRRDKNGKSNRPNSPSKQQSPGMGSPQTSVAGGGATSASGKRELTRPQTKAPPTDNMKTSSSLMMNQKPEASPDAVCAACHKPIKDLVIIIVKERK